MILVVAAMREGDLRLTGSTSPDLGRLEIFLRGEWGTVCGGENGLGRREADAACNQLGFTSAFRYGDVLDMG